MGSQRLRVPGVLIILSSLLLFKGAATAEEPSFQEYNRPTVEYKAEGLEDPFESKEEKAEQKDTPKRTAPERPLPEFKIQGIIWGGPIPQAIINEKVLKLNDIIEEARIVGIGKEGVTVIFDGREYKIAAPAASYRTVDNLKGGSDEEDDEE